jgi:hypothetical protein
MAISEVQDTTLLLLFLTTSSMAQRVNSSPYTPVRSNELIAKKAVAARGEDEAEEDGSSVDNDEGISQNKLLFLNAANFDFSNDFSVKYVGHVNIFSPSFSNGNWGLNTGIMKLNYLDGDTATFYAKENKLIRPLDKLDNGDPYLHQMNKYEKKLQRTNWSFYLQPTLKVGNGIFIHGHMELFVTKLTEMTRISTTDQDTLLFDNSMNGFVARSILDTLTISKKTYLSGYFGGGFTFSLVPWENGSLFVQGTTGITIDKPSQFAGELGRTRQKEASVYGFYLFRVYYAQKLSENNSTLILGTDIRGLFPSYNPLYSAYVGVNIDINSVVSSL